MTLTDLPRTPINHQQPAEPRVTGMNAAQMQALQEAARKLGEDVNLRKWCIEQAAKALAGMEPPVMVVGPGGTRFAVTDLAEQIHRFIVGQ